MDNAVSEKFSGQFDKLRPKSRPSQVSGEIKSERVTGSEGGKYLATAEVHIKNKTRAAGLVFLKGPYQNIEWSKKVMTRYLWLKDHGLPVVPTMRFHKETGQSLMTDLTRGGNFTIIDKHSSQKERAKTFIQNRKELMKQIVDIAEKAYGDGNGVFLDFDAYSVVVDKSGIGKIYLLDLGLCSDKISNRVSERYGGIMTEESAKIQAVDFASNYLSARGT